MTSKVILAVFAVDDFFAVIQVLAVIAIIVCWIVYRVYISKGVKSLHNLAETKMASAFTSLKTSLQTLRADLAGKESRITSGQSTLSQEILQSRQAMLESAQRLVEIAESRAGVEKQAEAVKPAVLAILRAAIEINGDSVKDLETVVSAAGSGPVAISADALAQLRQSAAAATSFLAQARASTETDAIAEALQQCRKSLRDAGALAKVLGLRVVTPV
ncbi:MAG: hypothetical protein WAO35_18830 [Terriglobia bacterium]